MLDQERLNDRQTLDDQTYAWIWDGAYRENSDAHKYRVAERPNLRQTAAAVGVWTSQALD
ncbi:hypothetical protein PQC27_08865 [Pseudomonas aeruginosa]|nr:hypothetical protein PQC27_08865 [Pseudomonas aeruginosa]